MATFESIMSKIDEIKEKMTDNEYKLIVEELAELRTIDKKKYIKLTLLRFNNNLRVEYDACECCEDNGMEGCYSIITHTPEIRIVPEGECPTCKVGSVLRWVGCCFCNVRDDECLNVYVSGQGGESENTRSFYVVVGYEELN